MGGTPTRLPATDSIQTYMQHALHEAPIVLLATDNLHAFAQHAIGQAPHIASCY